MPDKLRDRAVSELGAHLASGALQHAIRARFPLERSVDAFEHAMSGSSPGKVIIEPG
jgi:NADPH:quinone reductase-like Zn-dependent oxidoreductase